MLQHILKRYMEVPLLSYFMHTNGTVGHVGTLHLAKAGLYVALHESKVHYPRNLTSLKDFKKNFALLVSLVFDLERNALMIKKSLNILDCFSDSPTRCRLDPDSCSDANSFLPCTRPTFYDPPRDEVAAAVLRADLFGVAYATATTTTTPSLPSFPRLQNQLDSLEPDEFGCSVLEDGSYYNILADITSDRHLLYEEA